METTQVENKPVENKLCCRKCGGPHFTIKCGKGQITEQSIEQSTKQSTKQSTEQSTEQSKKILVKEKVYNDYKDDNKEKKYYKKIYRVKVSDLPIDMTEEEMMELTQDWGQINKIKVLNYESNSSAYIDFSYFDMAEYFIKALDRTPFESIMISVTHADSY